MARINTSAILNNGYLTGSPTDNRFTQSKISLAPSMSSRYDYSVTEDQSLLLDRKDSNEKLYEIFKNSPYAEKYMKPGEPIKIDKKDIFDIFYYCKEHLEKMKDLTAYEMTIAINEFFDFNYTYVVNKVLSIKMKSEIYEDYYNNMGMADRMDKSEKLF